MSAQVKSRPATSERAHRLHVAGRDELEQPDRRDLRLGVGAVLREQRIVPAVAGHRDGRRERHRRHAGDGRELVQDRLVHPHDRGFVLDLRLGNRQPERLHVVGTREPGMDAAQRLERPNHQARSRRAAPAPARPAPRPACCARDGAPGWRSRSVRRRAAWCRAAPPAYLNTGIAPNSRPADDRQHEREQQHRAGRARCRPAAAGCRARARPAAAARRTPGRGRRRRRAAPSMTLSSSSSRAIRPVPAPSAARIASSCWRDSARTSSRLATFAHAMSSTIPIVPISTHEHGAHVADEVVLERADVRRDAAPPRTSCTLPPGNGGNRVSETGISRATSAVACAIVAPGFSRAMAVVAELPEEDLAAIEPVAAATSETSRSRKRNESGRTPMISRGLAVEHQRAADRCADRRRTSIASSRPSARRSRASPGVSSAFGEHAAEHRLHAEHRQDARRSRRASATSSGSARPVTLTVPVVPEPDVLEDPAFLAIGEVQERRGARARRG